ncbi:hypothetical protein Tco_0459619 [Tanacetum coccineum]
MLNPRPDTGIDSIFNLNTEATSLVDVSVTTIVEPPFVFATNLPLPPTPLITHMQQTLVPTPTNVPSSSLQDLPNFGSLFGKEPESTSALKEKTSKKTCKSTDGSKSQHKSAGESAHTEEPMHTDKDLEELAHQEFDIGATREQSDEETSQHPDCNLAREEGPRESFDELMDTPLYFSAFMMNHLKIDTLTHELLADLTFELMKGQQYPHDLRKPLPLIPNSRGRQVIPFDHFINNDLAYLSGGVSSYTYATSVTKSKAADYGHIKWIEDLVPTTIWSEVPVNYNKHALGEFVIGDENVNNSMDLLLTGNLLVMSTLNVESVLSQSFKLSNGMAINIWIGSPFLTNLNVENRIAFGASLRMCTRSIIIQRHVKDLQLGVKSYQKKPNITKPDTYRSNLKRRDAYTSYSNPRGFIYQNKDKKNQLMRIDELYKFCDGTLNDVRTTLNDRLKGIRMEYLPKTIWRQTDRERAKAMIKVIDKQLKSRRIIRSLEILLVGDRTRVTCNYCKGPYDVSYDVLVIISYKAVRLRYSNPMIQLELEGSTQGYPLVSVEVLSDKVLKSKEFQRSFRHSDTERLSRSDEVLKLKNFKKDATLKLFKSKSQERSHSRQDKEQAQDLKSMITTSNHKLMIEVKDYEHKTKVKA